MKEIMLVVTVLFCALQNVTKKGFGTKVNGGGTFFFSGISSLFAMLFFICTSKEFVFDAATIPYSLGFGLSYAASLIFGYLAIASGSASLSALISSYSLMIPAFYGLIFLKEDIGIFFIPGLALLLISIFLINKKTDNESSAFTPKWIFYVIMSFIGGGMCSVTQKMQQVAFDGKYKNEFMIIALLFVLCVNIVFTLLKERKNIKLYLKKGWLLGSSCGIMNGVVNLFVMILTTELKMSASVMFPVIGAGTLIITYIFYRFMFKEVLTRPQLAGFVLGTISVLLLNI